MSKAEFLSVIVTCIGVFFTVLTAIERDIIKKLTTKDATSARKAIELQKPSRISRWRLKRLKRSGAIKEAKTGKLYYNQTVYKSLLRKHVIIVISILVFVLFVTILFV